MNEKTRELFNKTINVLRLGTISMAHIEDQDFRSGIAKKQNKLLDGIQVCIDESNASNDLKEDLNLIIETLRLGYFTMIFDDEAGRIDYAKGQNCLLDMLDYLSITLKL